MSRVIWHLRHQAYLPAREVRLQGRTGPNSNADAYHASAVHVHIAVGIELSISSRAFGASASHAKSESRAGASCVAGARTAFLAAKLREADERRLQPRDPNAKTRSDFWPRCNA